MKRKHVFVTQYGGIWRMTRRNYIRFLKKASVGNGYDLDEFGVYIGEIGCDPLDMTEKQFSELLKQEQE